MKRFILLVILINSLLMAKSLPFSKILNKIDGKDINKIRKLSNKINSSKGLSSKLIKSPILNKEISTICIDKPNYCALSKGIAIFSKKSDFSKNLITKTNYPIDVIRLDLKYGDKFVQTISKSSKVIFEKSAKGIEQLKGKFPQIPKISLETKEAIQDKMLLTLRYTGKRGWDTSQKLMKLAKENPNKSIVAGLFAWYVADPESFFENKEKALAFVSDVVKEGSKDITNLALDASSGVADSVTFAIKEKLTFSNFIVIMFIIFSFIIWKMRAFFKKLFTIKLDNILEKEKNKNKLKNREDEEGLL